MRKETLAQDATLKREDERAMINKKVVYELRDFKDCRARERAKGRPCLAIYGQKAENAGSALCGVISLRERQRWQVLSFASRIFSVLVWPTSPRRLRLPNQDRGGSEGRRSSGTAVHEEGANPSNFFSLA